MKDEREAVKSKPPGQTSLCELIRRQRDPRGRGRSQLRHWPSLSGDPRDGAAKAKPQKQKRICRSSIGEGFLVTIRRESGQHTSVPEMP